MSILPICNIDFMTRCALSEFSSISICSMLENVEAISFDLLMPRLIRPRVGAIS